MSHVIRVVDRASTGEEPEQLTYLASYDPDFVPGEGFPPYPSGMATWTTDIAEAMKFDSVAEAFALWTAQSKTVPYRPDGKPNKPLCGMTIAVDPA